MNHRIRVLLLTADAHRPTVTDIQPDLAGMTAAIGAGNPEALTLDLNRGLSMYLDEDGKHKQLPVNTLATRVAEHYLPGFATRDVIAGDAVIAGLTAYGDDTDVPTDVIDAITDFLNGD